MCVWCNCVWRWIQPGRHVWRPETDTVIAFGGQDRLVYLEFAVWDKLAGLFSEPLAFTRPTTQILGSYAQSHLAFAWVLGIGTQALTLAQQAHYPPSRSFSFTCSSCTGFVWFYIKCSIQILKSHPWCLLVLDSTKIPHHQSVSVVCRYVSGVCLSLFIFSADRQATPLSLSCPLSRASKLSPSFFSSPHASATDECGRPSKTVDQVVSWSFPTILDHCSAFRLKAEILPTAYPVLGSTDSPVCLPHLLPFTSSIWQLG